MPIYLDCEVRLRRCRYQPGYWIGLRIVSSGSRAVLELADPSTAMLTDTSLGVSRDTSQFTSLPALTDEWWCWERMT